MGSPYMMEPVNTFPDYEHILTSENRLLVIWNSESLKCPHCISALLPTISFNPPSCELITPLASSVFRIGRFPQKRTTGLLIVFDVVAMEIF